MNIYTTLNDKFIEFQEKISEFFEKIDLKQILFSSFVLSTYIIPFILINICIFYR